MNYLAENALPIWVAGAVAFTMALVVYLQMRTNRALMATGGVVIVTAALLVAEQLVETRREAVERTLYELASTMEANDVAGTLAFIVPGAAMRSEVEELMPLVNIERARVLGTPHIEVGDKNATVQCRGLIIATVKQTGMKGGAEDEVTFTFVERDGRWRVQDYSSNRRWRRALGR